MSALNKCILKYKNIIVMAAVFVLLNFGINYSFEYATDTYYIVNQHGTWKNIFYNNGRPLLALFFYVTEALSVPHGIVYHISQLFALLFLIIAVTVFSVVVSNYVESEIISVIISFITLSNPFVVEFMLFAEKGLFMLTILFSVIAVALTEKRWRKNQSGALLGDIIIIQVCLWCSVLIYQTIITSYVVLMLPFIAIYSKNIKSFLKKNIFVAINFAFPLGASYLMAKFILPVDRIGDNLAVAERIKNFIRIFKYVTFERFYHVNKGLFICWLLILCIACFFSIFTMKSGKIKRVMHWIYMYIGCVCVSFLLYITGVSTVCWPRMIYSYGMIFGIMSLYIFIDISRRKESLSKFVFGAEKIVVLLSLVILVFDYISFGKVFLERYRTNQEDMYYAEIIGQKIEEYEKETGLNVDTLCYYKDFNLTVFGHGYEDTMLSNRAQVDGWSRHNSIEIYLDREFIEGESDPQLEKMFAEKDWNMYSDDQLVFDGNKLHICVY